MNKILRNLTIDWLENNRNNGEFEGHIEDSMSFEKLDSMELTWYFEKWVLENIDVEDYSGDEKEELYEYMKDYG